MPNKKYVYKFRHIDDSTLTEQVVAPPFVEEAAKAGWKYIRYNNKFNIPYEYYIEEVELNKAEILESIIDDIIIIADKGSQPLYNYLNDLDKIKRINGEYWETEEEC